MQTALVLLLDAGEIYGRLTFPREANKWEGAAGERGGDFSRR